MEKLEDFRPTRLTLTMVIVGSILGSIVCISNMYFGLQVGSLNTMSTSTALISFAIFRGANKWLKQVFSPTENVVVQTIASSIAGMPVAGSMLSVIPALEFLEDSRSGDERQFTISQLILWSLGVSLFGTVFAAPFRTYFLLRQRLRFPGGYATGVLIGVLHNDETISRITELDKKGPSSTEVIASTVLTVAAPSEVENSDQHVSDGHFEWTRQVFIISKAFGATAFYVILTYFVPLLNNVPIFGLRAAEDCLWYMTLSPAFTAFGMILDLSIASSMLLGAILGWGILAPLAKHHGWAPGPVESMESGARGWLIWISISFLLGDVFVRVSWGLWTFLQSLYRSLRVSTAADRTTANGEDEIADRQALLTANSPDDRTDMGTKQYSCEVRDKYSVSRRSISCWLLGSAGLCMVCTFLIFRQAVAFHNVILAIAVAFPLCIVVIQSTGETDTVPSNALGNACQFLYHYLNSRTASSTLGIMIPGAITEAGLWQAAVLMTDLKTAYLVQASPKKMFHAQLLGSIIGCVVGSIVYRLITTVFDVPSTHFPIPLAHMWLNTARLANGAGLPRGILPFTILGFCISAVLRALRQTLGWRRSWLPSGVAICIGMYVTPSVTLAKVIGAGLRFYLMHMRDISEVTLMAVATGCILSEGTLGFLPIIMATLGIPRSL